MKCFDARQRVSGAITVKRRSTMRSRGKKVLGILMACLMAMAAMVSFGKVEANAAATGRWVLTAKHVYTPKTYISRQNNYYKYKDSYEGVDKKGFVTFKSHGGYYGPGEHFYCDIITKCSQPKSSYAPGEKAVLTLKTEMKNAVNMSYSTSIGAAKLCAENKDLPNDGRSKFAFNGLGNTNVYGDFRTENWKTYAGVGETEKMFILMPPAGKKGDKAAIVFLGSASADGVDHKYESEYGGYQIFEWVYTYKTVPSKGVVSAVSNLKGAYAKVTVKKISGAKGYQIKYKVAGSSKVLKKSSTSNVFKIPVKKGQKVTVSARVKNAAGWGSYGKAKSLTTDKK